MFKLFSVAEANKMLPTVDALLETLQRAARDTLRLRDELSALPPHTVVARNKAQELGFAASEVHAAKAELDRLGVFVQDAGKGTVDFPSQLGAEVVCLSYTRGQDAITHYHRLNDGEQRALPGR
jgi:hypothetical protein